MGAPGDELIIMAYGYLNEAEVAKFKAPKVCRLAAKTVDFVKAKLRFAGLLLDHEKPAGKSQHIVFRQWETDKGHIRWQRATKQRIHLI